MILEFSLIFILSLIIIKLIIKNAVKLGMVDVPNERSMHIRHHPRGAGIGVFLAVAAVTPFFNGGFLYEHILSIMAISIVFIVGVLDDHQNTLPNTKFIVLAIAALMVYFDGVYIASFGSLLGTKISLGWFALPFSIFAIVGLTNALNLLDGLDGLAGSISIVILGTYFIIGYTNSDSFIMFFSASFIAGLLAFMIYNWNPASIFMGDSGSLTLGLVISIVSVKALDYVHPSVVLFLVALPVLDTIIVMVRRKREGKSMFEADKTHIHHILFNFFNKNVKSTVIFLVVMQVMYSLMALIMMDSGKEILVLLLFILNVVVFYFILSRMLKRQTRIGEIYNP